MERIPRAAALAFTTALALALAAPTLGFGFSYWDDDRYVLNSPAKDLPLGACLGWAATGVHFEAYHPIHLGLLCLQQASIPGGAPQGYHAISVLLAGLMALAMAGWLRAEGAAASVIVAATTLFVAHPLMAEITAAIASQKDLLGLAFGFAALWVNARLSREEERHGVGAKVAPSLLVALAALTKSGYALFGLIIAARTLLFEARPLRARLAHAALPILVAAAALGAAAWIAVSTRLSPPEVRWFDPGLVAATLGHYGAKLVLPVELGPVYDLERGGARALFGGALAMLLGAAALTRRLGPWVRLGATTALLGVGLYANLVPAPLLVSDRFAAIFLLGVVLMVVPGLGRRGVFAATALVVVLAPLSLREQAKWSDGLSLWSRAVEVAPQNALAHNNLSSALFVARRRAEAEAALVTSIELQPERERAYRSLVLAFLLDGDCGAPVEPSEAAAFFARIPEASDPAREALVRQWPASTYVLALRDQRTAGREESLREFGTLARRALEECDPARAARLAPLGVER